MFSIPQTTLWLCNCPLVHDKAGSQSTLIYSEQSRFIWSALGNEWLAAPCGGCWKKRTTFPIISVTRCWRAAHPTQPATPLWGFAVKPMCLLFATTAKNKNTPHRAFPGVRWAPRLQQDYKTLWVLEFRLLFLLKSWHSKATVSTSQLRQYSD